MPAATAACTVATHSSDVVSPHSMPSPPPPSVRAETGGSRPNSCCCIGLPLAVVNGCHRLNAERNKAKSPVIRVILAAAAASMRRREQWMSTDVSREHAGARHMADAATFSIILALSFSHFLNDMMQSLVPALYPMLKDSYGLSFTQIGLITLTMQVVSSLLQPAVGLF